MADNSLKEMAYPGRGIGIGLTKEGKIFAAYFITGRSSGSKNRLIERDGQKVYTGPISHDPSMDPEIFFYDAMAWHGGVFAVTNGRHTNQTLTDALCGGRTLDQTMADWKYEPDSLHTPRIFGRITVPQGRYEVAKADLGIVRAGENKDETDTLVPEREVIPVEHWAKKVAYVVTTYAGDPDDVQPFTGGPLYVPVESTSVDGICREFGEMLDPNIAVCSAALLLHRNGDVDFSRINYQKK